LFEQIGIILLLSAAGGIIALKLKQPILISFIAIGILCGPSFLNLMDYGDSIEMLSKLGISLLLFIVGLKLDIKTVQSMGRVALATGLGQILFTSLVGYLLASLLGIDHINSLYIGIALSFSSTIIVVKLLSDKKEIDSLYGRIAIGFLIVQDIVVVLVMIALSVFSGELAEASIWQIVASLAARGVALLAIAWIALRYIFPRLLRHIAQSSELLVLFSIAWAVSFAVFSEVLGFSEEVGAFLAGMTLASSNFREAIVTRLVSLRDFLLLFFFIDLGASLDLGLLRQEIFPALLLSLFVLVAKPLIVIIIMGYLGYRKRTGLLAGLTMAQISEFSLIFVALGHSLDHVTQSSLAIVTLATIATISLSTYMIINSVKIYELIGPLLSIFERKTPRAEQRFDEQEGPTKPKILLFGLGRFGQNIFREIRKKEISVAAYDFDPDVVARLASLGHPAHYGDAEDPEFIEHLPLSSAEWVICAAPEPQVNRRLSDALRKAGYTGKVALTLHRASEDRFLDAEGYDLLLLPFEEAASKVVENFTS